LPGVGEAEWMDSHEASVPAEEIVIVEVAIATRPVCRTSRATSHSHPSAIALRLGAGVARNAPTAPHKGHRLPNSLTAPLLC
jgi:hypothetical protein